MIKTEAYNESKQFLGLTKKNGVNTSKLYTQKPLGFFSVTRNLAAYRTNQEGVLELMGANVPRIDYPITILEPARTNLFLYSQEFDNAYWGKDALTVTANNTNSPDNTLTADKITPTNVNAYHAIARNISITNGSYVISVYAKYNGYRYIFFYDQFNNFFRCVFDILNGVVTNLIVGTTANIQASANGFYRLSVSFNYTSGTFIPTIITTPNTTDAGFLANGTSGAYIWGAQLETGSTATAYIPTTNAPVTVPDVIEAGCPELLVENEATNLLLRSQEFDNASWDKLNVTINANATNAPDGTLTADKIIASAVGGDKATYQILNANVNNVYTSSAYFKASEYTLAFMRLGGVTGNPYVIYNLSNQTVVSTSGLTSYNITAVGNSWFRITTTVTATSNLIAPGIMMLPVTGYILGGDNIPEFTGNGVNGGFIWGAQLEQGNKATSYIPTTTATVTRPADNVRNNTIGYDNEESTIFVRARLNFTTDYQGIATLWDNDDIYNGYITMYYYISGGVRYIAFDTYNGSDTNQYLYTAPSDGVYSIAFAYHTGERTYRIAINGVLITDDEFPYNFPSYTLLTQMTLGSFLTYFNSRTKGFMYFDSMLDNDSLENLTVQ